MKTKEKKSDGKEPQSKKEKTTIVKSGSVKSLAIVAQTAVGWFTKLTKKNPQSITFP